MITPIFAAPPFANTGTNSTSNGRGSSFSRFINNFSTPQFRLLQSIGIIGWGLKEVVYDAANAKVYSQTPPNSSLLMRIKHHIAQYFCFVHGGIFAGSGLAGLFCSMHELKIINLKQALEVFKGLDIGLFFFANCLGLIYSIKEFYSATAAFSASLTPQQLIQVKLRRNSAILGMISCLNYVIWSALAVFGVSGALPLIFGCVAIFTGCFRVLYEFHFRQFLFPKIV